MSFAALGTFAGTTGGAATIGAAGSLGAAALSSKDSGGSVKRYNKLSKDQQAIFIMNMGRLLDLDPSIIAGDKKNLFKLLQSGELDSLFEGITRDSDRVQDKVYQGDRVADLTGSQKDIISGALESDLSLADVRGTMSDTRARREAALDKASGSDDFVTNEQRLLGSPTSGIAAPTFDSPVQVVGENGPEVLTAGSDLEVIPNGDSKSLLELMGMQRDLDATKLKKKAKSKIGKKELEAKGVSTEANGYKGKLHQQAVIDQDIANQVAKDEESGAFSNPEGLDSRFTDHVASQIGFGSPDGSRITIEEAMAAHQSRLPSGRIGNTIPTASEKIGIGSEFNPLGQESNTVGMSPEELLAQTQLKGLANGGPLDDGDSAVVGENGPELALDVNKASQQALSGQPSTQINKATTDQFIQSNIVDPANQQFKENTLPAIGASVAGTGFLGSQRVKATQRAADLSNRNITQASSSVRMSDEKARRDLAESAANRSANFVPTALDVQNQDLFRERAGADIGAVQAGTDATRAGAEATRAGTESTQFDTEKKKLLLETDIANAMTSVEQGLADLDMTDASRVALIERARRDYAETGRLSEETANRFKEGGMADQELNQIINENANLEASFNQTEASAIAANNTAMINQWKDLMGFANIEQSQNQAEMDAVMQKFLDGNTALAEIWAEITQLYEQ